MFDSILIAPSLFFHKEWEDFFSPSVEYTQYRNKNETLTPVPVKNYYVSLCHFIFLNETSAIRITDQAENDIKFLIDTSSFDKCGHIRESGGSLYINFFNGECIQDRICSFGSTSSSSGAYCYILFDDEPTIRNYLIDSTITSSSIGISNIYLHNGEINMKSINISNSEMSQDSIYKVESSSNSNVTLSTFSNNTSTNGAFHSELSDPLEFKILFSNFINNKLYDLIFNNYYLYIINCSFYNNDIERRYFSNANSIQIIGCYIDSSNLDTGLGVNIVDEVSSKYPDNYHFPCTYSTELKHDILIEKSQTDDLNLIAIKKSIKHRKRRYTSAIRSLIQVLRTI